MSVLKNIKSLFIVEENLPQTPAGKPETAAPATPSQPMSTSTPSSPPPLPVSTQVTGVDQRIFDSLLKALEDNNQQGFDFLEFKNSLQTLQSIIPDESVRYKSAFATAATMGLTVPKLLESAKFYQAVLSREKENFDKAVTQQVDLSVNAKQKDVESLQKMIQQKSEQIKKLTEEIVAHQDEMAKAQGYVAEATNKIETTKHNFYFTLDTVMNQIQTDIGNIERFLQ